MPRAYSDDLRDRAAASVLGGRTCRETAALFGVSVASVVKWSQRLRATGTAAARSGGRKRERSLQPHRVWLLARLAEVPDITLRCLVAELRERGVMTSYGSVWRLLRDEGMSFKKNAVRQRTGPARHRSQTPALEDPPGKA
jgi:transposase